ncbi:hypothetical protein [Thiorhodococcus minor]|uniref:Uncharacterized protein n=1 Tax=Thiorhodococcus minor TaxID=57489 RepID=A0A6M0K7K2_9GAMM|nr:hypothetical protein [Thiorhodococcus minor]NEV64627.1 hypothetical protein [Thiorhodococcus minor]
MKNTAASLSPALAFIIADRPSLAKVNIRSVVIITEAGFTAIPAGKIFALETMCWLDVEKSLS